MKNITLSIPDDLLKEARAYAKRHGISLNEMVRKLLKKSVINEKEHPTELIIGHTKKIKIDTTRKFSRDDIYDRKIFS